MARNSIVANMLLSIHQTRSSGNRRRLVAVVVVMVALLAFLAPGHAFGAEGGERVIPLAQGSEPTGVALGEEGDAWVAERGADEILRVAPTGRTSAFELPAGSAPERIAVAPGGDIWFTESGAPRIGRMTADGKLTEFPIGSPAGGLAISPSDGAVWISQSSSGRIGRLSASGQLTELTAVEPGARPEAIAVDAGGDVWFSESFPSTSRPGRVVEITPGGAVTDHQLSTEYSRPGGIVASPEGGIWLSEGGAPAIGRVDAEGALSEVSGIEVGSSALAADGAGGVWYAARGVVGSVGTGGSVSQFPVPFEPVAIAAAGEKSLWITAQSQDGSPELVFYMPDSAKRLHHRRYRVRPSPVRKGPVNRRPKNRRSPPVRMGRVSHPPPCPRGSTASSSDPTMRNRPPTWKRWRAQAPATGGSTLAAPSPWPPTTRSCGWPGNTVSR
jgi:virginiamycin B lyase